ncbi:MAG: hypothetical protein DRN37_11970 [Thermoplasmata archaeon]|nr:MAG: hypothetical protein DRN37_11970 [Thermoplasmata archaeon]
MESSDSLQDQQKKVSQEVLPPQIEPQQARQYLQCILENSNDLIFSTDTEGRIISFSKGGEKVLGYTLNEVIGRSIQSFATNPAAFEKLLTASRNQDGATRQEMSLRHKQGHGVHCFLTLTNLTNEAGEKTGTIGICRDITVSEKLREDLIRIDRLAEIGRIAADIVHELNNPIAVIGEIAGWAGTVVADAKGLSREDREELDMAINNIGEQTKRCRNITVQLLTFARDSTPSSSECNLREVLEKTIGFLNPELKHGKIEIVFDIESSPCVVQSDPRMLEQVFVNLLSNAIYALKEKGAKDGRIELRCSRSESYVTIMISDNGPGIAEEDQEKIFSLFYTTKPPGKGTGLGLPICQNIIRNLGGEIDFESKVGEGTTFTVKVPLSRNQAEISP